MSFNSLRAEEVTTPHAEEKPPSFDTDIGVQSVAQGLSQIQYLLELYHHHDSPNKLYTLYNNAEKTCDDLLKLPSTAQKEE